MYVCLQKPANKLKVHINGIIYLAAFFFSNRVIFGSVMVVLGGYGEHFGGIF